MSVNSKLTAIADAIREKTGESGTLTLDGMAAAVAGIEAGGGNYKVTHGSFTPSESTTIGNTGEYAITHGLGEKPSLFVLRAEGGNQKYSLRLYVIVDNANANYPYGHVVTATTTGGVSFTCKGLTNGNAKAALGGDTVSIYGLDSNTILSTATYQWLAVAGEFRW